MRPGHECGRSELRVRLSAQVVPWEGVEDPWSCRDRHSGIDREECLDRVKEEVAVEFGIRSDRWQKPAGTNDPDISWETHSSLVQRGQVLRKKAHICQSHDFIAR